MPSFFERSLLIPHKRARRELQREIIRAAEGELRSGYRTLEKQIAKHAAELTRANEGREQRSLAAEARFAAVSEACASGRAATARDGTAELVGASYPEMLAGRVARTPWISWVHPQQ